MADKELSFQEVLDNVRDLCLLVQTSGFKPDCILALVRGGMVPATILSHQLNVGSVYTYFVSHYNGRNDNGHLSYEDGSIFDLLSQSESNVLIVDDINDSGATLDHVMSRFQTSDRCKSAVLIENTNSSFTCDYAARRVNKDANTWIKFPWEVDAYDYSKL